MNTSNHSIIEAKLSYEIMSVLFKAHNQLGNRNKEKHYQKAIEIELTKRKIKFEREKYVAIIFEEKVIGKYYLDFLIENKIVLETKTVPILNKTYQNQILGYMRQLRIKLGILANFRSPRLTYQRLVLPDKYMEKPKKH